MDHRALMCAVKKRNLAQMHIDLRPFVNREIRRRLERSIPRARAYFDARMPICEDLTFGIGGNTFRVFRGVERPSAVYRIWASRQVTSGRFSKRARDASSTAAFERLHSSLCKALAAHWRKETGQSLALPHKYKLIDLFVKHAARLDFPAASVNRNLIEHGHVPIDSRVLRCLNELLSGIFIGGSHAMGSVKTENAYRFVQSVIQSVMVNIPAAALYFDYFAWNLKAQDRAGPVAATNALPP